MLITRAAMPIHSNMDVILAGQYLEDLVETHNKADFALGMRCKH